MTLYRDEGVVLRTIKLGEADRIATIATRSRGKVRAVVKGVRRTSSRWGARMEPLSHVAILCWSGRGDLDVVNQAEVLDTFGHLREDYDRLAAALSMLEAVDHVSQEGHPNPQLYRMLVGALRTLEDRGGPLVLPAFYMKLLALEGAAPVLDSCAACGAPAGDGLVAFDIGSGGALCRRCRSGRSISPEALALLRRILEGDLASVLAEHTEPGPLAAELDDIATRSLEHQLERRLRSRHIRA